MTTDLAHPPARLLSVGDAAWTVEFGNAIDPAIHGRVLGFSSLLDALSSDGRLEGVVEWVPTFRSVTVHFDPLRADALALHDLLAELAGKSGSLSAAGCRWHIPVCFDASCAPDLDEVAAAKGMGREDVVRLMTETVFTVYMLGFLPGFPYLGGLPEALDMPRLATPRKVVPSRSIAIAGRMCAAYPWQSPGGWRLLGRTPVRLFDPANARRPALLAPGDQVVWQAIDTDTYEALDEECAAGRFDLSSLLKEGEAT
ncbi:sensor histidine kinase inhibitor, KipI family [Aromatoleum tolulyticum]|uniref:Sensor histidine kinase inhibitor, KipI family n=1 Tax=Aromatoleum tolulyticum TaxID=34027 RepID=A0A1N6RTW2_9RHOO|nr:5-oxoprolinase subunit PxpB [Aromatoleum tolulyticum]SIQ32303.1 sensor histidine kinase inhibitor, KipI family [Aromatoleum tolulyticum]